MGRWGYKRGGGQVKFYPCEKGGGVVLALELKVLAILKGGGAQKVSAFKKGGGCKKF